MPALRHIRAVAEDLDRQDPEIRAARAGTGASRFLMWLAVALLTVLTGTVRAEEQVTFRIHDRLDPHEIEETTSVYIDRQLVRTIHLDAAHPYEVVTVT